MILRGEATGHAHRVDPAVARVLALDDELFLQVLEPATVTHEEHGPIPLEPGDYEVIRQREFTGRIGRYVAD